MASFRARYKYHLSDGPYAKLLAQTPVFNTWDDHEITDDWGAAKLRAEGKEQLLQDGVQAFFEYWPLCGVPEEPHRVYRPCVGAPTPSYSSWTAARTVLFTSRQPPTAAAAAGAGAGGRRLR